MSSDFLLRIDGLSSENLVSETLAYILRERAYAPFQRLFYGYLFGNSSLSSTMEANFEIETQQRYPGFGIPDIIIRGLEIVVIIENKFDAPFVGTDQLSRYFRLLMEDDELSKLKERFLVLLTTTSRLSHYAPLIVNDFISIFPGASNIQTVSARMLDSGIGFKMLEWQEIMKRFESDDILVSSLVRYVNKNYVREVKFMPAELKALESKDYAEAMEKLIESIDRLRERIHSDTSDTRKYKATQSINQYGFYINMKNIYVWFGYVRPLWLSQTPYTPLYLQVDLNWISDDKTDKEKLSQRIQGKYKPEPDYGYVKAYPVSGLTNLDAFAEDIRWDLDYLDDACRNSA